MKKNGFFCHMRKSFQIFSFLLSGYMVLAMGGLSIFHHFCNCKSEVSTSVIIEQSCCSPSPVEPKGCLSNSERSTCGENGCDDCNCETQVEILTIDFTIAPNQASSTILRIFQFTTQNIELEEKIADNHSNITIQTVSEDKSPPKAGRFLLILYQNIKIPFSVS